MWLRASFAVLFVLSVPGFGAAGSVCDDEVLAAGVRTALKKILPYLSKIGRAGEGVDLVVDPNWRSLTLKSPVPPKLKSAFLKASGPFAPSGQQVLSYTELGARLGDQSEALLFMAVGDLLGFWEVLSWAEINKVVLKPVSDEEVAKTAARGFVVVVTPEYFDYVINRFRTTRGKLATLKAPHGQGLHTVAEIKKGEVVFGFRNAIESPKTYQSVQIGPDLHVHDVGTLALLNHSCDPNVRIDTEARTVIAIRDIPAGQMLTFCYLTTETDMDAVFNCGCGAGNCLGTIAGARHTRPAILRRYEGQLAPYVRSLLR